jgi:hypothetical protein
LPPPESASKAAQECASKRQQLALACYTKFPQSPTMASSLSRNPAVKSSAAVKRRVELRDSGACAEMISTLGRDRPDSHYSSAAMIGPAQPQLNSLLAEVVRHAPERTP